MRKFEWFNDIKLGILDRVVSVTGNESLDSHNLPLGMLKRAKR